MTPELHNFRERNLIFDLIQASTTNGMIDAYAMKTAYKVGHRVGISAPELDRLIVMASRTELPPIGLTKRFTRLYNSMKLILTFNPLFEQDLEWAQRLASQLGFDATVIPALIELLVAGINNNSTVDELLTSFISKHIKED